MNIQRTHLTPKSIVTLATIGLACLLCSCQNFKPFSQDSTQFDELEAIVSNYNDQTTGLSFPIQLGKFQLVAVQNFDRRTPGLGHGISYRKPSCKLEFFIYDWENPLVPDGVESPTIKQANNTALLDVKRAAATGYYQNFESDNSRRIRIGELQFLHTSFTYREDNIPKESHLLVAGFNTQILKVRITLERKAISLFKTDRKTVYRHIAALMKNATERGYNGVSFEEFKALKLRLKSIQLEDGLNRGEALTITQVELINRGYAKDWELLQPIDISVNSNSGYRATFPSRNPIAAIRSIAILVSAQGEVTIEETL